MPLANAIEGAPCGDAILLYGIFLPETTLHCTLTPHFFQLSVLLFYLRLTSVVIVQSTVWFAFLSAHFLDTGCFHVQRCLTSGELCKTSLTFTH